MPQDPRGLQRGILSMPDPLDILESADDGDEVRRVLRGVVHNFLGSDAGRPAFPHHFQRGSGCISTSLDVSNGGGSGRAGQARTRG